jgi:hypothetical protein
MRATRGKSIPVSPCIIIWVVVGTRLELVVRNALGEWVIGLTPLDVREGAGLLWPGQLEVESAVVVLEAVVEGVEDTVVVVRWVVHIYPSGPCVFGQVRRVGLPEN